jgi:hypothetical protein
MRSLVTSVLAVLAGALLAPSCYAERQPPPNFRYKCDSDGDCKSGQSCMDGLCETPCTVETFADDCPNGELYCLNGVCSSGCDLEKENACPEEQQCADLGIDLGGGGGGFFGGGDADAMIGVCMRPCTDTSCGELSVCIEGFCVQTCVDDSSCNAGTICQNNLCLPDFGTTTNDIDTLTTMDSGSSEDATATITDSGTDTGMDTVSSTLTDSGMDTITATGGGT